MSDTMIYLFYLYLLITYIVGAYSIRMIWLNNSKFFENKVHAFWCFLWSPIMIPLAFVTWVINIILFPDNKNEK